MPVQLISVPADAIKDLADEINLEIDVEVAREIMYRFGLRCGKSVLAGIDLVTTFDEVPKTVAELMEQTGICKVQIRKISGSVLELQFQELNTELNFTLGAIAGIISEIQKIPFECVEENGKYYAREISRTSPALSPVSHAVPLVPPAGEKIGISETGIFYLYEGNDVAKLYKGLKKFIAAGYPTLCVTREFPEHIKKNFGIDTRFLWLTGADRKEYDYAVQPTNLAGLYSDIKDFIISNKNSVVFISGIEYIISNTSYSQALRFLQSLRDRIALSQAIGVLYLEPGTLETRDVKTFERELVVTKWFDLL
ncbi:MAG: DUF835 domain-containing protein [Thermoplasmata archaeon]|nr:DUF835 domain-containing protein [Thermoplasmata archaeon]